MRCPNCFLDSPDDKEGRCEICGCPYSRTAKDLLSGKDRIVKEERKAQVEAACTIELALNLKEQAIIEAPTGVGKSFSTLVPAILSKKRTVVSTATHALQTQLLTKDLPFLSKALEPYGIQFSYALAKGKGNYVCGLAVKEIQEEPRHPVKFSPEFVDFAQRALEGKTSGDRDQLDVIPTEWNYVSANECVKNCKYSGTCGFIQASTRVKNANIVVANHSLVGFDLALSNKLTQSPVLGPYQVLILDEAHQAARYIRSAFTHSAGEKTPGKVKYSLEKRGISVSTEQFKALDKASQLFFSYLPAADMERPTNIVPAHLTGRLLASAHALDQQLELFMAPYKKTVNDVENRYKNGTPVSSRDSTEHRGCKYALQRLEDFREAVKQIHESCADANIIAYVKQDTGEKTLVATPVKVGPYLKNLYEKLEGVIATSATITVSGDFGNIRDELGMTIKHPRELLLRVKSPFPFEKNAVLYISRNVPEPPTNDAALVHYAGAVANEVERLVRLTEGRAFILFTSAKELDAVYGQLATRGLNLMKQGKDLTAGALQKKYLEEARLGRRPVLLGLKSFWEGVSIEGDALSLVVIVKLPFQQLTDPIYKALCERSSDSFNHVSLPHMVRELQQGTGRLIRTMTDKGIVAILDRRLTTKAYSGKVLNSLPFGRPYLRMDEVAERWNEVKKAR